MPIIQEVTGLHPIEVDSIYVPTSIDDLREFLSRTQGCISVGGTRKSMGGQTAVLGGTQVDMRGLNRIVHFSQKEFQITVESGCTWRQIQEYIDPYNLSISIMQTYADFSVGGSLSVNVHGRYIGLGPLILSVASLKVVAADGTIYMASKDIHPELFYGCIGGYGGIGIIVEATLQLVPNTQVRRHSIVMDASKYPNYFQHAIRNNPDTVFHNADIYPSNYNKLRATSWNITPLPPLENAPRLIPPTASYRVHRCVYALMTHSSFGKWFRQHLLDPVLFFKKQQHSRNYEASYSIAELEPASRETTTYVLQEYFCSVGSFHEFLPRLTEVFQRYGVNVINISIRHAHADPGTLLAWAKEEVFAFVVYYAQSTDVAARLQTATWTRECIDIALSVGGSYYLPYELHATREQFQLAYPRYQEYGALKQKYDTQGRLTNMFIDAYFRNASHDAELPDMTRFSTIYAYDRRRDAFYQFLQHIFTVAPPQRVHEFFYRCVKEGKTDKQIYESFALELPNIQPFGAVLRYGLPALKKQKTEMIAQIARLLEDRTVLNGVLEIGGAGRYFAPLRGIYNCQGEYYLRSDEPIDSHPIRIAERQKISPYPNTAPLTYTLADVEEIPDASLDVILVLIGLHHCPLEQLESYIFGLRRKLRPSGVLLLRDHDVDDAIFHDFVALAHDVYNSGTGASWEKNNQEIRNFRSISQWDELLKNAGFCREVDPIFQMHDPTRNALLAYLPLISHE